MRDVASDVTTILDDADLTLYKGDCLEVLTNFPDASVDMIATSPPFYGLRDYGVEGQIGLEETPDEWAARLVAVFRECRRVLADHGTLWIEIGDSYIHNNTTRRDDAEFERETARDAGKYDGAFAGRSLRRKDRSAMGAAPQGGKVKDLLGQPWMLAFALRADGWYLRSEIIWSKPNPMPESVTDRPTKSHSTVFLLSKQSQYFYDQDAVRESFTDGNRGAGQGFRWNSPHYTEQKGPLDNTLGGLPPEAPRGPDGRRITAVKGKENSEQHRDGERWPNPAGANARSVWSIPTEPTPFAHFATWPQALVRRMILAGTSERGKCPDCGKPWVRDVERVDQGWDGSKYGERDVAASGGVQTGGTARSTLGSSNGKLTGKSRTLGWSPSCACDRQPVPCVVLDPFAGSGTTLLVARALGRHSLGIELNEEYCKLVAERTQQLSLLT